MPKDPLTPDRILPLIEDVSRYAQQLTNDMSQRANAAAIHAAMITGYKMACEDHDIPVPDLTDPKMVWGV